LKRFLAKVYYQTSLGVNILALVAFTLQKAPNVHFRLPLIDEFYYYVRRVFEFCNEKKYCKQALR